MIEPWSQKLKSRKFILTILVTLLAALNEAFGLGIDQAAVATIAGSVAAWVLGESALDRERIKSEQTVAYQQLQAQAQAVVNGLQQELQAAKDFIEGNFQAVPAEDDQSAE